jgi:hypothetical protein
MKAAVPPALFFWLFSLMIQASTSALIGFMETSEVCEPLARQFNL